MARFIVTGGTGALGREVVRALVGGGHTVAVPYRDAEGWRALAAEMAAGPRLSGEAADLSDVEATARFVDQAAARMGGLDGVAAIAGAYAGSGPLDAAPVEEWTRMMRTNLDSAFAVCRAALPHLSRTRGAIVTVGSKVVEAGGAGAAAYAVSKAGVVALTRVLALENKDHGVRVNCVLPGVIDTAANRSQMPGADRSRWTPPAAIARVIVFLAGPDARIVSGAHVPVYGRA